MIAREKPAQHQATPYRQQEDEQELVEPEPAVSMSLAGKVQGA